MLPHGSARQRLERDESRALVRPGAVAVGPADEPVRAEDAEAQVTVHARGRRTEELPGRDPAGFGINASWSAAASTTGFGIAIDTDGRSRCRPHVPVRSRRTRVPETQSFHDRPLSPYGARPSPNRGPTSGEVCHFEIPADDAKRANKFYSATFEWKMSELPGMDYTMVSTGPVDEGRMPKERGFVGGGIRRRGGNLTHPVVTILVDDITAAEKTIEKYGGKIVQRKQPIGDGSMSPIGYFKDIEGNIVGLYQAP